MVEDDVAALVRAAADGQRGAWDALVERFGGLVWAVARAHRLSSEDAADVFQTTWLRLVEHLPTVREPDRVGAWLATTARRESLRILRRSGRETSTEPQIIDLRPDDRVAPGSELAQRERNEALWRCLEETPERCRTLLRILMADPPPSYTDVAEALDMPIGSIGPTRRRCLENLRQRLHAVGVSAYDE